MDKKEQNKLISYFIMGDGGVYRQRSKTGKGFMNAKFIMNMKQEHIDYIKEFEDLIDFTSVTTKIRKDYNTDNCIRQPQYRTWTGNHPRFTAYWERIYTNKYKGLDPIYIKQLDWHSLAILYMSDGSLGEYLRSEIGMQNKSYSITLNMKRLSYGDLELLGKYLTKNLGLYWSINRQNQYYYLRFKMKSFKKLMEGMEPFIHPSFKYKIRTFNPSIEGDEIVCTSLGNGESGRNDRA